MRENFAFFLLAIGINNGAWGELILPNGASPPVNIPQSMALDTIFFSAPWIYTLLFFLSVLTLSIWLYLLGNILCFTTQSKRFAMHLRKHGKLSSPQEISAKCRKAGHLFAQMVEKSLSSIPQGSLAVATKMVSSGKATTHKWWQILGFLYDIALVAPMVGLLGTVIGMFIAFYNLNPSTSSINTLCAGFGIATGTTVAGLAIAILALCLHAIAKYSLVRHLTRIEFFAEEIAEQLTKNITP